MGSFYGFLSGPHWAISEKMAEFPGHMKDAAREFEEGYREALYSKSKQGDQEEAIVIPVKPEEEYEEGGENRMADHTDYDVMEDFVDYVESVASDVEAGYVDAAEAADHIREVYEDQLPNDQFDRIEARYKDLGEAVEDMIDVGEDTLNDLTTEMARQDQRRRDKVNNAEAHANYVGNRLDDVEDTMDDVDRRLGR